MSGELVIIHGIAAALSVAGAAAFVAIAVLDIKAPYGRYSRAGWGPLVPAKVAWILQELPVLVAVALCWTYGRPDIRGRLPNLLLLGMLTFHYVNRTFIFPLRIKDGKPTPLVVMAMAFAYCALNGYVQARYLTQFAEYADDWLTRPQFLLGSLVFVVGMAVNWHADGVLLSLRAQRKPGSTERYKIPRGGMFEYVSGANFFGEIVEWTGFAIACWSWAAASFAFFTFCNIGPRGYQHHQSYLEKFEDYPKSRKAVIPFIW